MLEPTGRNTAPALTLAALAAADADPVLLVMPADHVIADLPGFQAAIDAGIPAARDGAIVTFGIVPDRAETGYGYIRCGAEPARRQQGHRRLCRKARCRHRPALPGQRRIPLEQRPLHG